MDLAPGCAELISALSGRLPRLSLGFRSRTRANWDVGWHHHDMLELVYHHRGSGQAQAEGGEAVPFSAGDVVLHAPRSRHRQPGSRDGEDWCLHLTLPCRWPAALPALIHLPGNAGPCANGDLAALTEHPGAALTPAAALARDLRAGAVLVEALAALTQHPRSDAAGGDHAISCQEIIASRFAGIGLIDEIAEELRLSPDRLRHLFKARFGLGPRAYLRRTRLRAAQRLLAETPLGLDEIAVRCGIGNARQLCELFSALAGTTPGAWRRRPRRQADT